MGRVAGWEARLARIIAEAGRRPYHPEEWNCCLFARECVQALTGELMPPVWRGTVAQTVDGAGLERLQSPSKAQRGDLVLALIPDPAVGVCLGARSAFVGPAGLSLLRTSRASMAWRV